jgi:effector-binding domain-containing protein
MRNIAVFGLAVFCLAAGFGLGQTQPDTPKIGLIELQPFTYVCIPHRGPISDMAAVIGALMQAMGSQRLFPPTGPMMGVYYTAPGGAQADFLWEIGFPVSAQASAQKPLEKKNWTFTTVASAMHVGPYDQTAALFPKIMIWLAAQGYAPAGPVVERYLDMNPNLAKPEELRTEIWVPCRKIK